MPRVGRAAAVVAQLQRAGAMRRTAGLLVLLLLTGGLDELDAGELRCEEAVKHLVDCCPGFNPQIVECGGACASPVIDIPTSACIARATCSEVHRRGYCTSR